MSRPLAIAGMGMISCLGKGAEVNAAAMRCDYDGFQISDNIILGTTGLHVALAPIPLELRGISRLVQLASSAIDDLAKNKELKDYNVPLVLCLSSGDSSGITAKKDRYDKLVQLAKHSFPGNISSFYGYATGRISFIQALDTASELLYGKNEDAVLIVSVDSLISPHDINYHLGNTEHPNRLLSEDNPNGFVSGEASTAILLRKPSNNKEDDVIISGFGFGSESADIYSTKVLKAEGLIKATNDALQSANISSADTGFRIASVSGESYFFKELSLTHTRTMEGKQSDHPLWHPADSIGETGSAIGGAMTVMASHAFKKNYSIGNKAICHISNDNEERGSFIVEFAKNKLGETNNGK